jgi:hypothetical protein
MFFGIVSLFSILTPPSPGRQPVFRIRDILVRIQIRICGLVFKAYYVLLKDTFTTVFKNKTQKEVTK